MSRFMMRGRRLRPIVLGMIGALCCARLGSIGQVRAEAAGEFSFVWSAPEECPSQQQVQAEIARLVGGDLRLHDGGDLRANVTVAHGPAWSADLTTQQAGRSGRRSIEAPSCQAAADAIALIVALSIDPDAVAANSERPRADAPVVPEAPANAKRQLHILAGVHAQGRVGTLPGTDVGAGLGIGVAGPRWRAELRWTYGLRQDQVASLPSGASGRFNLASGSLTGCLDLGRSEVAFGPCAVVEAGRLSANGYGLTAGFSRRAPWLAVGGGPCFHAHWGSTYAPR